MPNLVKEQFLAELTRRYGALTKLPNSNSLFIVGDNAARVYIRYSKIHPTSRTFFGLRQIDLQSLSGQPSFIAFLTDQASNPIIVPYEAFEHVFQMAAPASDGQYKAQLFQQPESMDLYIAGQGRFNVDGFTGFDVIDHAISAERLRPHLDLQHHQVQTLLAGIGYLKGFDVFVPDNNAASLDWALCPRFDLLGRLPPGYEALYAVVSEVDVVWVRRGTSNLHALFEVEHSTPVYSGLLRFNDLLLTDRAARSFYIVSNDARRDLFARQLARPTFRCSGLAEVTSFLDYPNVFDWYARLSRGSHNAQPAQ